jgi:hypothetical protein
VTRIPEAVAVASLDTHRMIVAVPNEGPAEVMCHLPRSVAANILRQLANSIEGPAGHCDTALATAAPCPIHDAPAPRPAGLDDLLATAAAPLPDQEEQPTTDWVDDVRQALNFNEYASAQALATLRDVLLDDAPRTPDQALAAALVLLAAHTRELSALTQRHYDDRRATYGVTRGSRGLLTGIASVHQLLDRHATTLDYQANP